MSSKNDQASVSATITSQCCLALLLAVMAILTLPGCRSANGVQVDVMERELRQQENYIYELEDYLTEYSDKLRKCRCANPSSTVSSYSGETKLSSSSSVPTLAEDDFSDDDLNFSDEPEDTTSSTTEKSELDETLDSGQPEPTTEAAPMQAEPPTVEETPLEDLQIPELDIEEPTAFRQNVSTLVAATTGAEIIPDDNVLLHIPDPASFEPETYPSDESAVVLDVVMENETQDIAMMEDALAENVSADDTLEGDILESDDGEMGTHEIDRIVIQHLLRGSPQDEAPSDKTAGRKDSQNELSFEEALFAQPPSEQSLPSSLLAVVEIRDQADEPVEADGPVSLMVMKVGNGGKARRIHRWDFTLEEVSASWQSSQYGDGLHLELPMDGQPLDGGRLELWARLVSVDGQKYLTKLPFQPQQLVAFGDEPARTTEPVETQIAARTDGEASQLEPSSRLTDSGPEQPLAPASRWRASMVNMTSRNDATSRSTSKGISKSARWSAQPSGGRLGQTSSVIASPRKLQPQSQPRYLDPRFQTMPGNDSTIWRAVQPGR